MRCVANPGLYLRRDAFDHLALQARTEATTQSAVADEVTSVKSSTSTSSAQTSSSKSGTNQASKTLYPQELLSRTKHEDLDARLRRLTNVSSDELNSKLQAMEYLLLRARAAVKEMADACGLEPCKLDEKKKLQPVLKAFFVVIARDIVNSDHFAIWAPTTKISADITSQQPAVSGIPDLVVSYAEIFSIDAPSYPLESVMNFEVKRTQKDTVWASRNQSLWHSAAILLQWRKCMTQSLASGEFEYFCISTNLQSFCFMSTKEVPVKDQVWSLCASDQIEDTAQIAGELLYAFMVVKNMMSSIHSTTILRGRGASECNAAQEDSKGSQGEDSQSLHSQGTKSDSLPVKQRNNKIRKATQQGPQDLMLCTISSASTLAFDQDISSKVTTSEPFIRGLMSLELMTLETQLGRLDLLEKINSFLHSFDKDTACKCARVV